MAPNGEMLRIMNIRDGFAMKAAIESGYNVCIISGGSNEGVRIRLKNLGINVVDRVSITVGLNIFNKGYLQTKQERMSHMYEEIDFK